MKTKLKIFLKCVLILAFLAITPFFTGFQQWFMENKNSLLESILKPEINLDQISIKERLALLPDFKQAVERIDQIVVSEPFVPKFEPQQKPERKSVYIYNTHQSETYSDGTTVYEIGMELAQMLEEQGFYVVFQTANFLREAEEEGLKYNQLYTVSRRYLNDVFAQHGGFDLVIDLHRDSAPRSASVLEKDGTTYAKMMFVVGMKSDNAASVMKQSEQLTDKIDQMMPGIMRSVFERQSVYNQDMAENMVLLELGTDQNSTEEVRRSLAVLIEALSNGGIE